jgi:hypothetical protein
MLAMTKWLIQDHYALYDQGGWSSLQEWIGFKPALAVNSTIEDITFETHKIWCWFKLKSEQII